MLEFVEYRPEHLRRLQVQEHQAFLRLLIEEGPEYPEALLRPGLVHSALDGEWVVACAGILPMWEGRAIGWAFFAAEVGSQHFLQVTRRTLRFLDWAQQEKGFHRIETTVAVDFLPGVRWAHLLGFTLEGRMPKYCPEGRDHFLYGRIV